MSFSDCHPGICACFFVAVLAGTILFFHPIFLLLSLLSAILSTLELRGMRGVPFIIGSFLLALLFAIWYGSFQHFGITPLWINPIGNAITMESLLYSIELGGTLTAVLLWLVCLTKIFTCDKIVYLVGRIFPKFGLLLAVFLRLGERIRTQWRQKRLFRRGIGLDYNKGSPLHRLRLWICIFSSTVTWTLDSLPTISDAITGRGGSLPGRTAYSLYRFDRRDRTLILVIFSLLSICLCGHLLGQTVLYFDPKLHLLPVTVLSPVFWCAWGIFCFLPLLVDITGNFFFRRSLRSFTSNNLCIIITGSR